MAGIGLGGCGSGLITVREAHDEDVGACAALAAAERADDPELARARLQADLGAPRRRLFVATVRGSLDLHARLGFVEVTRDFAFPGVVFDGGVGVLCRAARQQVRRRSFA